MFSDIKRSCHRCDKKIPVLQRILAVYDWSIECKKCGHLMETSVVVLFSNMLISQYLAFLVVRSMLIERDFIFFLILETWAFVIFLPIVSTFSYGVVRH